MPDKTNSISVIASDIEIKSHGNTGQIWLHKDGKTVHLAIFDKVVDITVWGTDEVKISTSKNTEVETTNFN